MDKQVVMGKLDATQSFGEVSIILNEPVTCSIVTATEVDVAIIEPHRLKGTLLKCCSKYNTRAY